MQNLIQKQQEIDNEINKIFQSYERKYETIDQNLEGTPEELLRRRAFVQRSKFLSDMTQQCYGDIMQLVGRAVERNDFEIAHYVLRSLYNTLLSLYKDLNLELNQNTNN